MNESNWQIEIDEVSAGVFKVIATHASGAKYETTGTDPDELREGAQRAMCDIERLVIQRRAEGKDLR